MKKRYPLVILVIILAYGSLIFWDKEGSRISQRLFSKEGHLVAFNDVDEVQYGTTDEYSFGDYIKEEVYEQPQFTTPEAIFSPGNFVNTEESLSFAKALEELAIGAITEKKEEQPEIKPLSGATVAQLLEQRQQRINDLLAFDTIENNKQSQPFIDVIKRYFEWLLKS